MQEPDSSGKRAQLQALFQSLIHQGKNASNAAGRPHSNVLGRKMFQSLIHQGKNARTKKRERKIFISSLCFNPLFIRGKMQVSSEAAEIGNALETVSIPYSSGEKCKRSRRRGTRNMMTGVSIPYSSGEKCKSVSIIPPR